MASSSGSSPGFLPSSLSRFGRIVLCALGCGLPLAPVRAEMPAHLRTALAGFNTAMPSGWAYTLSTVRNERSIAERFDPAQPPTAQWTLLQSEGRAPTAEELEKYRRARSSAPGGNQANFEKSDIDPGSFKLVKEDAERAEFSAAFRETATGPDKMLGHLSLTLTVDKRVPHVAAYALELKEPYSPVLGVKMNTLRVEVRFSPPADGRPSLPVEMTSHFDGSIFLIPTGEVLRLTYRDHSPPLTELSR
jgi:hypothetical protein